jgi:Fe-S-cluster-containing hydrogenase component 2
MAKSSSGKTRRYVVLDCSEEIPCNPCEEVCGRGAIVVGDNLNAAPVFEEDKCDGCGACIAVCPGSCVYLVEEAGGGEARVTMAYDRLPRPLKGDVVTLTDGEGASVGQGIVYRVKNTKSDRHLWQVTVSTEPRLASVVRGFRQEGKQLPRAEAVAVSRPEAEEFLICRCEEVTLSEFARVVDMGVRRPANLRRFTRTGLGLCQGKACTELLIANLSGMTGMEVESLGVPRARPPVRPVKLGELGS